MTLKPSEDFDTQPGRFEYSHIAEQAFSVGLTVIRQDDDAFAAAPEKTPCDWIADSPLVSLRCLMDARVYMEEGIRTEPEDFRQTDAGIFEEYAKVGKKAGAVRTLLKLRKHEERHL